MVLKDQEVIFKMLVEFGHIRTRALISPTIRRKSTDLVPEKIPFHKLYLLMRQDLHTSKYGRALVHFRQ